MNQNAEILFSTILGYLGWTPSDSHPLYDFVKNDDTQIMEEIRPDDMYKNLT